MVKTTFLIRHGESTSNAGLSTADPGIAELTDLGREQAQLVSQIISVKPDLIITSPYIRAKQTAEPTINRFRPLAIAQWPIQEFSYLEPTRWAGSTMGQRLPAVIEYWEKAEPDYRDGPNSETFTDFMARIDQLKTGLGSLSIDFALFFSHGLFLRGFLYRLFNSNQPVNSNFMRQFNFFCRGLEFPNCGILKLSFHDGELWHSPIEIAHIPEKIRTFK